MRKVFGEYFKEHTIWMYLLIDACLLSFLLYKQQFWINWPVIFILLLVPFYEYGIHKYILHTRVEGRPDWFKRYMARLHTDHHKYPSDIPMIFAPFSAGIAVPVQWFLVFWLLSWNIYIALAAAFTTMSYYLFYEWIHLAHHVESYKPKTRLGKTLKRAHLWHHYKNENYWWGITSNLGDRLLGSFPNPKDIPHSTTVRDIHAIPPEV